MSSLLLIRSVDDLDCRLGMGSASSGLQPWPDLRQAEESCLQHLVQVLRLGNFQGCEAYCQCEAIPELA